MRTLTLAVVALAVIGFMAPGAEADLVLEGRNFATLGTTDAGETTFVNNFSATDPIQVMLAKFNQGGATEDKAISASFFDVDFVLQPGDDPGEASAAEVSWNLTGSGFELWYVLVVDGTGVNALYSVTADQRLIGDSSNLPDGVVNLVDSTGGARGISHISFFGAQGTTTVPEPSLLLLLGTGLAGTLAIARRLM